MATVYVRVRFTFIKRLFNFLFNFLFALYRIRLRIKKTADVELKHIILHTNKTWHFEKKEIPST